VLWIVGIVAALLFLGLGLQNAGSRKARLGWLAAFAAVVFVLVALRFGARALSVVGPLALWLAWSLVQRLRQKRVQSDAPNGRSSHGVMTREQALRVLGLQEGASLEAVAAAHRQLIKKLHPDQGGSGFLTQQVNEARKVLESG